MPGPALRETCRGEPGTDFADLENLWHPIYVFRGNERRFPPLDHPYPDSLLGLHGFQIASCSRPCPVLVAIPSFC